VSRSRQLALVSIWDNARLALRFPRTAFHLLRNCATGRGATSFPRRIGLFLTNRCDFACSMCAVQDARNEGIARGGDLPFEFVERVLAECSPHQPVVDLIGGEPLLYPFLIDAVKLASRRKVLAAVTTNGLKLAQQNEPNYKAYSLHSYGAHFAEVGVDTDTAEIRLHRMLGVFAAGRFLNPKTARSQLIGGMTFGGLCLVRAGRPGYTFRRLRQLRSRGVSGAGACRHSQPRRGIARRVRRQAERSRCERHRRAGHRARTSRRKRRRPRFPSFGRYYWRILEYPHSTPLPLSREQPGWDRALFEQTQARRFPGDPGQAHRTNLQGDGRFPKRTVSSTHRRPLPRRRNPSRSCGLAPIRSH
jgi:hypothetical protein